MQEQRTGFKKTINHLRHVSKAILCGLERSALAYGLTQLQKDLNQPLFIVVPTLEEAQRLKDSLNFFLSPLDPLPLAKKVFLLPEEPFLPFSGVSPRPEVCGAVLEALFGLLSIDNPVVITTPKMLMSFFIPISAFIQKCQIYKKGEEINRETFIYFLQSIGYERLSLVEGVGEFSVRGSIIDIFCPLYKWPLRLEFFSDILETIRLFNPLSQRSERHLAGFTLIPTNPIPREETSFREAKKRLEGIKLPNEIIKKLLCFLEIPIHQPGIEDLFPLFYEKTDTLFDYLPKKTIFCLIELAQLEKVAHSFKNKLVTHLKELAHEQKPYLPLENTILAQEGIKKRLKDYKQLFCYPFPFLEQDIPTVTIKVQTPFFHLSSIEKQKAFREKLEEWQGQDYKIALVTNHPLMQKCLMALLETWHFKAQLKKPPFMPQSGINIYRGDLPHGFILDEEKLVVLGEMDWQIRTKPLVELPRKKELLPISSFEDLKEGDFVVHLEHGIGLYKGLRTITTANIIGEFLLIEYQDKDKLYLPIDKLYLVQKYRGVEDSPPSLDKLGGGSWQRTKERVKKATQKVAKELIKLYATRLSQSGYAFSPPDSMFNEFIESFPYTETPDQQYAIDEVLNNMMHPRPMDRLICGDVGFGKTEVAIRAAFKAILDSKQVALLVPTTILAEQHYLTFKVRLSGFPVNIVCLSRFRPLKEQRKILERLKKGRIDIIIGTHRLLQKDVIFKDLGLVIVDEEHRFGVKQKERLKTLKTSVDVISLSATPIPRTLYLSLLGIRDLSLIETPPPDRRTIKTYLAKFSPILIKNTISKELARGGQVFFVQPRVRGIVGIARFLKRLLPFAHVGVAHGQLPKKGLEEVMHKFIHGEINVLLCTNIVESGLDIPNANTIIINRADMFGLAQLYHLRGRVGRSKEQAYALLLVSGKKLITQEAKKRLRALLEHTELSSSYKLASYDLRLRGAGNILGTAQTGQIAAVGYEMYLKILQKAVQELKGEAGLEEIEPEIKLPIMAYIPKDYIADQTQRVIFYKRLSQIKTEDELGSIKAEIKDRYGHLPQAVENLFQLVQIKIACRHLLIKRLDTKDGLLRFCFDKKTTLSPLKMIDFLDEHPSYRFTTKGEIEAYIKKGEVLKKVKKIIEALKNLN
jgi:transcription-repair coupling factor (superfamily II helicase)